MKRFTATEKWSKEWFQGMAPRVKCLWQYVCDHADAAGVWEPNFKLASYLIGEPVAEADLGEFGDRIVKLGSGKFHLTRFIEFQYGQLSKACKAHIPVVRALEKHRLSIAYGYPMHRVQEEEEETEKRESAERESSPERPGAAPKLPNFIAECARYSVPAWFAEEKHGEWSVKQWKTGATPVAWREVVRIYVVRDYGNAGKPIAKPVNGSLPRRNRDTGI